MSLLFIDAGNTRIKWAIAAPLAETGGLGRWRHQGSAERAEAPALADAWRAPAAPVTAAWVSNVAGPALRETLQAALRDAFGAAVEIVWFASVPHCAGVRNGYRRPTQLGCDRFAAAIGARALFPDQELLVATCGTATTIDAVTADGAFLGGMILPGLGAMTASLASSTAQLPQIERFDAYMPVFADNTDEAIAAGCVAAQAGAIEHAMRARRRQVPDAPLRCVLAGGAGALLAQHLALGDVLLDKVDNLVLPGLQVAAAAQADGDGNAEKKQG